MSKSYELRIKNYEIRIFTVILFYLLFFIPASAHAAPPIFKYKSFFDSTYASNRALIIAMAENAYETDIYNMQAPLMGLRGMFEATRDTYYLDEAFMLMELQMSKATIIDSAGYKNWPGPLNQAYDNLSTPTASMLSEMQGASEYARIARVALKDPSLSSYHSHATAIYNFVKNNIVEKWLYHRNALCCLQFATATNPNEIWDDKTDFAVRLLMEMYTIGGDIKYKTDGERLLQSFLSYHLKPFTGTYRGDPTKTAYAFDVGKSAFDAFQEHRAPDTAHTAREPDMLAAAYELGFGGVMLSHILGMANDLTEVIWDQSLSSPRFSNYIDGDNSPFRDRPAWNNGYIAWGWETAGQYSGRAEQVLESTLDALIAGISNPSLDFMIGYYGKLTLAGILTRNQSLKTPTPPSITITPSSVPAGSTITVSISNAPGNTTDWAGIFTPTATGDQFSDWKYLNNTQIAPTTAITNATLTFTAPSTAGTYEIRLYQNNSTSDADKVATRTFTVTPAPTPTPTPAVTLSANPASITQGQSSTLTWSSTNATSCTASGAWTGAKSISGTQSVSPTVTSTYTLTCTGSGGTAAQNATLTVTLSSTKFAIGDRVQVTAGPLNVRSTPSTTGTLLGTQNTGALGTVTGGPINASGFNWWQIVWDNGMNGWSVEDFLAKYILLGDLNNDKIVNSLDWSIMNGKWLTNDPIADLNKDGTVNTLDWSIMSGNWLKTI